MEEWHFIKGICDLFCTTSGMSFSLSKSAFRHGRVGAAPLQEITNIFSIESKALDIGFTYLGFFLRPNSYLSSEWDWILKKVHYRLCCWSSKWLSLGGHLTLLTSMLQSLPIYWFGMFRVPTSVLDTLCGSFFRFLW